MVLFGFGFDGVWLTSFDTGANRMSGGGCGVSRCNDIFLCFFIRQGGGGGGASAPKSFPVRLFAPGLRFCSSPVLKGDRFEVGGGY